jgi:hypothetical protein
MGRSGRESGASRAKRAESPRLRQGRPALSSEVRRSNRVVTFLTDAELAQLQGVAAEDGSSLSAAAHKILASSLTRRQRR